MFREKIKTAGLTLHLLCLMALSQSCQRDDICPAATPVTPMLNIAFFDANETDVTRAPSNLRVRAIDPDTIIFNRENTAEIRIPLRTDMDITEYEFTINAPALPSPGEEEIPGENTNADRISFIYSRDQIYINRACSYKVIYLDLQANLQQDDNPWINNITIEEETVENETEIHINIYH